MRMLAPLLVALATAAFFAPAIAAAGEPQCTGSLRVGSKLLRPGDDATRAWDLLGKPDRVVDLTNRFGVVLAHRWHWRRGGYNARTIRATIERGQVVEICRIKP
ncbi:MAG: hypothetical protein ABF296_09380 [Oceanococcaceae bacterium]